jgi:molybdenum cofactor cytidylyltransferase
MSDVAALVLAAGQGTRFGEEPKLLARFRGTSLVRCVAQAALGSCATPVIAVTGHRAEEIEAALADLAIEFARNPSYAEGLSTSLKAGFRALPEQSEAAIVLLGDMPLVGSGVIDRLVDAWRASGRPSALVPISNGRRSNPVVLSRALASEIMDLEGDVGAGPLLRRRDDVAEYLLDDPALLQDVDTPDALAGLRARIA